MDGRKTVRTPISTTLKITHDEQGKSVYEYISVIGDHLYLTASWPHIAYSVSAYARYQADPRE